MSAAVDQERLFRYAIGGLKDLHDAQLISSVAFDYILTVLKHEEDAHNVAPAGAPLEQAASAPPMAAQPAPAPPAPPAHYPTPASYQPLPQQQPAPAPQPYPQQQYSQGYPAPQGYPQQQQYPAQQQAPQYAQGYSNNTTTTTVYQPNAYPEPVKAQVTVQQSSVSQHHFGNSVNSAAMSNFAGRMGSNVANAMSYGFGAAIGSDAGHTLFYDIRKRL